MNSLRNEKATEGLAPSMAGDTTPTIALIAENGIVVNGADADSFNRFSGTSPPQGDPILTAAKTYVDAGYWVHWLEGPNGNPKSGKTPIGKGWGKKPKYTYAELAATYKPGLNIGIRPGPWSKELNLIAIDGDLADKSKQAEFDAYLKTLVGDTPIAELQPMGGIIISWSLRTKCPIPGTVP